LTMAQHQPPPPVIESTVDQPNAEVEGEVLPEPEKSEGEFQRQKPEPDSQATVPCGETLAEFATGTPQTTVIYRQGLQKMLDEPDGYLGRTITVDGEMHRQFNDRVFTIQKNGRGTDLLVITVVPMSESVIPLEGSFETHKQVRLTGVLRPYDRGKLECLFGPLDLESREGHSFVKNPVLIIGYKAPSKPVAAAMAPPVIHEKPTPPPEPAAAPPPAAPELVIIQEEPAPAKLPKTAGDLPLVGMAGLAFLLTGISIHFFRRAAAARY
jgi:hypothetical protein